MAEGDTPTVDNLNRVINMTMDAFRSMLQDIKSVGSPTTVSKDSESQEKAMKDLTEALSKFSRGYEETAQKQKQAMNDVVNAMKGVNQERANKSGGKTGGKGSGDKSDGAKSVFSEIEANRALNKLHDEMWGKGEKRFKSEFGNVTNKIMHERNWSAEKLLHETQRDKALQAQIKRQAELNVAYKQGNHELYVMQSQAREFENLAGSLQGIFGMDAFKTVFSGQFDEAVKYTKEIRNVAYTTLGIGADNKELQRQYEDIGNTVAKTGVAQSKFTASYAKAIRNGISNAKQAQKITTAQLNTETQLGLEAGALEDTFQEMALHNGMNADQIANMGRGMAFVAKETGLSGAAMQKAVESSKQMVTNLRNAGNLTTTASQNMLQLAASAQKFGVEKQIGEYANSLSSSYKLFFETNGKSQTLLLQAVARGNAQQEQMNGTLLTTKQGQKKLAEGMKGILKDFGINDLKDIDNLSAEKKAQINFALEANFGKGLGEFRQEINALEESSMSAQDKMKKYADELKDSNKTEAEKTQILKKQRELTKEMSAQGMQTVTDALARSKNMNEALDNMFQSKEARSEMIKNLKATGSDVSEASSNKEIAAAATKRRVREINEDLKKAGKAEVQISDADIEKALASDNQVAFKEINEKLTAAQQETSTEEAKSVDPYTKLLFKLEEKREGVQNVLRNAMNSFFDTSIGYFVLWASAFAGIAAGAITTVLRLTEIAKTLKTLVKGKDGMQEGPEEKGLFTNIKEKLAEKFGFGPKKPAEGSPAVPGTMPSAPEAAAAEAGKAAGKQKFTPEQVAEAKAAAAAKASEKGMDQAAYRASRKQEEKKIQRSDLSQKEKKKLLDELKRGKKEDQVIKQQQKNVKNEAKQIKNADKVEAAPAAKTSFPAAPEGDALGDLEPASLAELGGKFAKLAPAIAILAAGALLLGTAIVYLGDKMLSLLGLDVGKIVSTAAALGAIAAVGAAVVVGSLQALKLLEEAKTDSFEGKGKDLAEKAKKMAGAVLIIGPAIIVLGAALVWAAGKVLSMLGIDLGKVAEIAGTLVAVAGVAGAIAVASGEFVEVLDKMEGTKFGEVMKNPAKMAGKVARGAFAILTIGGALILIGGALVWLAKTVFGFLGIDASTALEVAGTISAVAVAIGIIAVAGGILTAALYGLGKLAPFLMKGAVIMGKGALVLLAMTGGMILLGAALGALIKGMMWILGKIGLDANGLHQAADDLAAFMGGLISICLTIAWQGLKLGLAVVAMAAGLIVAVPAMAAGAAGVLAFAVATLLMGAALLVLKIGMMGWDADSLEALAEGVNSFISGVGSVAWAITSNALTIGLLGLFAPIAIVAAAALTAAGVGMLAISVGFILLGSALGIMNAALSVAKVDETTGETMSKFVDDIVNAAWNVAYAIAMNTVRIGKTVFWLATGAAAIAGLLGVSATFMIIGPAFANLAEQIINMGKLVSETVSPDKVQEIVQNLDFLLSGTETIAFRIAAFAVKMVVIGAFLVAALAAIPVLNFVGEVIFAFQEPIQNLIKNVMTLGEIVANTVPVAQAVKIAMDVETTFWSVSIIAGEFIRASVFAPLIAAGMLFGLMMIPVIIFANHAMHLVADALQLFTESALYLGERLADVITPTEAIEIILGMQNASWAAYNISTSFMKMAATTTLLTFGFAAALMTIPAILFSTGAMFLVADALQLFSVSAFYLGDRLAKTITAEEAEQIIVGMETSYQAAYDISKSFMWMAARSTLLSLGAAFALATVPAILFTTLAIRAVGNALNIFAKSAVYLGDLLSKTITPDEAEEIITGMKFAYNAAHEIALAFMWMAVRNATLAMGFAMALMTIPLIVFGTLALWSLYLPLQAFVDTARFVAQGLTATMPPDLAEELVDSLDRVFDAAYHIALSVIDMSKKLVVIGMGFMLALMAVPFIYAATGAIMALFWPLKAFVETTRFAAEELTAAMPADLAEELVNNLQIAFDAAYNIALSMIEMSKKLAVIGMGFLIALMAVPLLYAATGTILAMFGPLELFLLAVNFTATRLASIIDPEAAAALAESITTVFDAASTIAWSMVSLSSQMAIIGAGFIVALLAIPFMYNAAKTISLLSWPIKNFINSVINEFPVEQVENATGRLDSIVAMFDSLGKFVSGVFSSIANLGILRILGSIVDPAKIAGGLWTIGSVINEGIIDPILNGLPETSALDEVVNKLDSTVEMLLQVQEAMSLIGSIMASINTGIDATAIENLPLEELGQICTRITGGGKPMLGQGDTGATALMSSTPSDQAIDQRIASEQAFAQDRSMKIMDELATAALRGSGILVQEAPAASATNVTATTAAPMAGNMAVEAKIAAKKASSKPQMAKVAGDELSEIAESSNEQVELTNKLVTLFQQVVDALKPKPQPQKAGAGEQQNTDPNTVMAKPAKYYKSTNGQVVQGPAKAIMNVGPPKSA